jgi:hypothetical protein
MKINWLMLYRETIADYFENHAKYKHFVDRMQF